MLSCRGLTGNTEGPRSKLARVTTAAVPSEHAFHDSRRGATAAEAVDLSDDDDDVVIIEEGMQPHSPKGLKAAAKQPGRATDLKATACFICATHESKACIDIICV